MSPFDLIDPRFSIVGALVGALVGMTGVGGGSLMTPMLIVLFGVPPAVAVGTDLLHAAVSKSMGSVVHGRNRTIDWTVVRRLAIGSVPAAIGSLYVLAWLEMETGGARQVITAFLIVALCATTVSILVRDRLVHVLSGWSERLDSEHNPLPTVTLGAVLGVLVSISSVGAGAIAMTALILLYPRLPTIRIVGSDIAHAVPLTLIAGLGHQMMGSVDWHVLLSLLAGSIPGIYLGSSVAARMPDRPLRIVLAVVLVLVIAKLAVNLCAAYPSAHAATEATATNGPAPMGASERE